MNPESTFTNLFCNNPQPMWFYRVDDLAFLDVNDAATALYGYSHDEFTDMTLLDIRPPAEVPGVLKEVGAMDARSFAGERICVHRRKDGSLLHVRVNAHGVDFHGEEARLVCVQDLTEEQRAIQALRHEKAFSRRVLDTLPEGIAMCDRNGEVTYFNPALRARLGLAGSQEGRQGDACAVYGADGTPMRDEDAPLFRALRGETVRDEAFVVVPSATQRAMHVTLNVTPLCTAAGDPDGAVIVVRDITGIACAQAAG